MLSLNLFCLAFGLALLPTILTAPTQAGTTHDRDTASVTKPVLDPPIPDLSQWLLRDLNSYQGVEEVWENVNGENGKTKTFEACKEWFGKVGFDVEDIETSNVTYSDCEKPWMVCRHKDAEWSAQVAKEYFGRIPTRMRSNIAHLITLPALDNNSTVIHDRELSTLVVIGHPSLHDLLAGAAKPLSFNNRGYKAVGPFYATEYWKEAVEKDGHVANNQSRYSDEANLAQETVVALFDVRVRGGVGFVAPNAEGVRMQVETIKEHILENTLDPEVGFKCTERAAESGIVEI